MALSVIEGRLSQALAARVHGVSAKIVARWGERFKSAGRAGMVDRSSRPRKLYRPTEAATVGAYCRAAEPAPDRQAHRGVSPATVSRVLKRTGLSRLKDIEPAEPVRRYE